MSFYKRKEMGITVIRHRPTQFASEMKLNCFQGQNRVWIKAKYPQAQGKRQSYFRVNSEGMAQTVICTEGI